MAQGRLRRYRLSPTAARTSPRHQLDGSGKIINRKKDVILGRKEGKYLVIDAELNERLLTKEEIYEEKPYGFYGNVILNICRINLEEA